MKNRRYILMAAAALVAVLSAGCVKEHQCECTDSDAMNPEHQTILTVDAGMKCESITEMGKEVKVVENNRHTLHRVGMRKVTCRDYGRN